MGICNAVPGNEAWKVGLLGCGAVVPLEAAASCVSWVEAMEAKVEQDDSRSECASVYLTVVMCSSSGVRKETRFSAGNLGRAGTILRGTTGLLARMETRWWGCL